MTTVERAYRECHEGIYYQALNAIKCPENAEDIRSNVYLKLQRLDSTEYKDSKNAEFVSWIHTVTNSVIIDFFRTEAKKQGRVAVVSDYSDQDDENKSYFFFDAHRSQGADQKVLNAELNACIHNAIDSLKPKYKRIATMFFLREMEYTEIANVLDIPMGSVKGMLSRARAKLQTELDGVYRFKAVNVQSVEA